MAKKTKAPEDPMDEVRETPMEDLVKNVHADEPKEEAPVETPKVEEKPEEKGVDFDPEKFKEEVTRTAREQILEEVKQLTTKTKEEAADEFAAFEKEIWEKEGRTPTYKEALLFVKDSVKKEQEAEKVRLAEEERAQKELEQKTMEERKTAFNKYIDEQMNELHAAGRIDINNKDQTNALLTAMMQVNEQRTKEGKAPIYSVKEIFYEHYKAPTAQPAGADAPISGGSTQGATSNPSFSIDEVRNKSFLDILMGK